MNNPWEDMRRKVEGRRKPTGEPTVCVCGHSKYHHSMAEIYGHGQTHPWLRCLNCHDCPGYEELIINNNL